MKKRLKHSDFSHRIVRVDPGKPDASVIRRAADAITNGGLGIFPTWSLYGIGADIGRPDAVSRVFHAKRRLSTKPIAILIGSRYEIPLYALTVSETAHRLMETFWPGRLTIVLAAAPSIPEALTGRTGKIGIRVPFHPVAVALLKALEHPITGTSANLAGQPGCADVADLAPEVMAETAIILDAGPLFGGAGSTVVDATTTPPTIIRQGSVSADEIKQCLGMEPGLMGPAADPY